MYFIWLENYFSCCCVFLLIILCKQSLFCFMKFGTDSEKNNDYVLWDSLVGESFMQLKLFVIRISMYQYFSWLLGMWWMWIGILFWILIFGPLSCGATTIYLLLEWILLFRIRKGLGKWYYHKTPVVRVENYIKHLLQQAKTAIFCFLLVDWSRLHWTWWGTLSCSYVRVFSNIHPELHLSCKV